MSLVIAVGEGSVKANEFRGWFDYPRTNADLLTFLRCNQIYFATSHETRKLVRTFNSISL